MSAEPAFAAEPEYSDGDGDPPTSAAVAALLGAVLQRVMDRGPLFKKLVEQATAEVQADYFQHADSETEET